jgi:hypothetical protein
VTDLGPQRVVFNELLRQAIRRNRLVIAFAAISLVLIGIMGATGRSDQAKSVLSGLSVIAPLVAGILTMGGIVSDDRESGVILLWFQKPRSLIHTYGTVFALKLALLVAFVILIAVAAAAVAIPVHLIDVRRALHFFAAMLGFCLVPATIVFAMSAWRVKRDSTLAFLVMFASVMLGVSVVFDESLYARIVRCLVFPMDPLQVIAKAGPYVHADIRAFLIVIGQVVGWTIIGFVGLRMLSRSLARGSV